MKITGIAAECGGGCDLGRKGPDVVYSAAERGEMDYVLVAGMTCLGRVIPDTMEYVRQPKKCVFRVFCADGMTIDNHAATLPHELIREAKTCSYCGDA